MQINEMQLQQVNRQIERLVNSGNFYGKKLKDAGIDGVRNVEDFESLPFSEKQDLREAYPLGLMAVPRKRWSGFIPPPAQRGRP